MLFGNTSLLDLLYRVIAIVISFTIHEFAHGFSAYMLGDSTAKHDGRLSLNPIRHVDPIGFLILLFFGFGWAKPVMIDPSRFKDPKVDMAITAFAGPFSNFVLAFISVIILYPLDNTFTQIGFMSVVTSILYALFGINIVLGIFNMIPFPPLDGSKVFGSLLPTRLYFPFISNGGFSLAIILILAYTGVLNFILTPLVSATYNAFIFIAQKIYFFL